MKHEDIRGVFQKLVDLVENGALNEVFWTATIKGENELAIDEFNYFLKSQELSTENWLKVQSEDPTDWTVTINKKALARDNIHVFLTYAKFIEWMDSLKSLESNFFNENSNEKRVYFEGDGSVLMGSRLALIPIKSEVAIQFDESNSLFPSDGVIKKYTRCLENDVVIEPLGYHLSQFDESDHGKLLCRHFIKSLCACLATDIIGSNKIKVKGRKSVEINLTLSVTDLGVLNEFQKNLMKGVGWVYEGNSDTRLKLIADGLSLDLSQEEGHSDSLIKLLPRVFDDAQEKYLYFISERTDEFYEDKRGLQVEIQNQISLYNDKLRSQINSLLRDILAAVFLVGIGLITRTKDFDLAELFKNQGVEVLFKTLSFYFLLSIVIRSVFGLIDVISSRKELFLFSVDIRSKMSEKSSSDYIRKFLEPRERIVGCFFGFVVVLYVLLAVLCWRIPSLAISALS